MYKEYLENSEYTSDDILKLFLVELKTSQLYYKINSNSLKTRIKKAEIPNSSSETRCKNDTINRWRKESKIVRYISPEEKNELNRQIEPKIEENKIIRRLSWKAAHNQWINQ